MYDRIVIAVDGSDEARQAVRRALALARVFDATVDVLYVVERKALKLTETSAEKTRLRDRAEDVLADLEELADTLDHPVRTTVMQGKPAVQIVEFCDERNADLVVVGRQGLTGLGERLLGGVTEYVLHRSEIPVLVFPAGNNDGHSESEYSRLLLPTDGSENAEVAIPHGTAIASRYDAAVHVLNVVNLQAAGGVFDAGGLDREFVERLEARGEEAVGRFADEISTSAPELSVTTTVEQTRSVGGVADRIRTYVEEHEIDLVVMGSHGRSNLERQLLGSVAASVLRTVDVPVLVAKRAD